MHAASPAAAEPAGNAPVGLGWFAAVVPVLVLAAARLAPAPAAYPAPAFQLCELHPQQHRVLAAAAE